MKLIRYLAIPVALAVAGVLIPANTAQAATKTCSSSTPVASRPTLRSGDIGTCVAVAQKLLVAKGYSVGSSGTDGSFGPATKAAVVKFQSATRLVTDGVIGPITWGKLTGTTSTPPKPSTYSTSRGPNNTSRVVLTFDDCPKSLTAMKTMVQYARSIGVGMVLAPTGNCISSGKFSASYARAYGAYVINHSVSHPDLTTLSYASVLRQLSSPGVVTNYGRPPFGANNATVRAAYAAKGMKIWNWGVDTRDWTGKTSSQVISSTVGGAYAGSTVLMHMQWNGFTPSALSAMKTGLAKRGLSVCRPYPGTTPVNLPASLPC